MLNRRHALRMLSAAPLAAFTDGRAVGGSGIEEEGFVPIGGIEQWLSIRGESRANPVMLFLHGGPGEALSPFASLLAPWNRPFTVVLWDQRGAGRTFGRNRTRHGEMSLERLSADTIEITEYLRRRMGQDRIVLAGQSWGSVLGWTTIRARPDLFSAYVGTGQSVNWARAVRAQETYARQQAMAAGDNDALTALDQARLLPIDDLARTGPLRRWLMPPSDLEFIETQRRLLGPPPFPETGELADWVAGFGFSAEALTPAVLAFDAYAPRPVAETPVIVIQGRDDHITPTPLVEQFMTDLRAPSSRFVTIEGGHFACYTNAQAFADALATHVRPLVG